MKKVLAIVLCAAMIFKFLPAMNTRATENLEQLAVYHNGNIIEAVVLPQNEKVELTAATSASEELAYQWQILAYGDLWVNIEGKTDASIDLSYAMVANLLADGVTKVRCKVVSDAGELCSQEVSVTVAYAASVSQTGTSPESENGDQEEEADESGADVSENESEVSGNDAEETVTQQYATFNVQRATTQAVYGVAAANETAEIPATYSIVINYIFADGKQAANPWTANVAAGSNFTQTVTSPTVLGYTPDQASVALNYSNIDGNKTVTVTYVAALVDYTVVHYQQNLNDDNYTEVDRDNKTGYTEDPVGEGLEKSYEGFYSLLYDTTTAIAADGSTVVEIYYDRYYYLMTFDLDGGYGVEPIYARYGARIEIGTPTRAGYTFNGWNGTIPATMPADNTSFKAQWTAGNVTYDVVFWYENANDDGYSQAGVLEDISVAAGSKVNGSSYANTNFTGRDSEHFIYSHADENVVIKGDGSTVVNVYFSRNEYTLTFPNVIGETITCNEAEHTHSDNCCKYGGTGILHWGHLDNCCNLGLSAHKHSDECYTYTYTVTAKYDADITSTWTTDPIKSMLDQGYVFQSSVTSKYYSFLEKMPGQNITMTATLWSGSTYTWYYYLEVLPDMDTTGLTTRTDNGKTYYEYDSTTVNGSGLSLTYEEDYYPITGFTQRDSGVPDFNWNNNADAYLTYLYYTRNSYTLTFSNNGDTVAGRGGTYLYQQDISGANFVPEYPDDLEEGAYIFDGWYSSPFYGDTKFEFTTTDDNGETIKTTMPANNLTLYARWVPTTHNVRVYPTVTDMENNTNQIGETEIVDHGNTAIEPDNPTRGEYTFVGWFYMDGDTEKAFDFSMPVTKNLDLYAKWSSNVLMSYTIHYQTEDGKTIATDTVGSALAGTTKTFEAKSGSELNEGYQSGYFPKTNSHSLTIDIEDPTKNEFIFVYVPKEEVQYIVKYLEYETNTVLHEEKQAKTRDAVITETFEPITGYMPDAYQKRLVLSVDETQNVIIFWYVKDDTHAPVQIIHYIQNAEGDGYTEYQSSTDLNGIISDTYSTDVLIISGYTYDHATANDVAVTAEAGKVTGTVTAEGLILELYYNRNLYPYEFRFLEQGTNAVLADSVTGMDRYGSQVTQNSKNIPGYTCSDDALAMTIQIEDGSTASKNVRIFYYTEQEVTINYVVVAPAGAGTVSPATEILKVFGGNASGSTPTANDGYRFVGWYIDEGCTTPVEESWVSDGHITPQKTKDYDSSDVEKLGYEAATYYALFELGISDLKIQKMLQEPVKENQNFIFEVNGIKGTNTEGFSLTVVVNIPEGNYISKTVTLADLPIGSYTVTEQNNWRYQTTDSGYKEEVDSTQDITLVADSTQNIVTFYNKRVNDQWLSESVNKNNQFVGVYKGTN